MANNVTVAILDTTTNPISPKVGADVKYSKDGGSTFTTSATTNAKGVATNDLNLGTGTYTLYVDGSINSSYADLTFIDLTSNKIKGSDLDLTTSDGNFGSVDVMMSELDATYADFTNSVTMKHPSSADFTALQQWCGTTNGVVRQFFANSDNTKSFSFNAEFGATPQLRIQDQGATLATFITASATFLGNILPSTDNTKTLGNGSFRFSEVFAGNGTINTSDKNLKTEIKAIPSELKIALKPLKPKMYKYKDSVELKGSESARLHFGYIAQDVEKCLEDAGLNPEKYSFLCKDEITESKVTKCIKIVQEPVTELIDKYNIELIKGKYIRVKSSVSVPVIENFQVYNSEGVAIEGLFKSVPKTIDVEKEFEEIIEVGTNVYRYGLRYQQLELIMRLIDA